MRKRILIGAAAMLAGAALGTAATAEAAGQANAELRDLEGKSVGGVSFEQTPHGVLVRGELKGVPPGAHALHVHGDGLCEPPFESAGGHFNPDDKKHGLQSESGPHAGDMPNIHVPASGELTFEVHNVRLRLDESLFDDDGAAVVVHAGADDYRSDPAGDAGDRIACGVIEAR